MNLASFRILVFLLALFLPTTLALACHCLHGSDEFMSGVIAKELKDNGGVLVEAEALSNQGEKGAHTTTFKVLAIWVGQPGSTITVRHNLNGEACGLKFEAGQKLFLLATAISDGVLVTNQCLQGMAERAHLWGKPRVKVLAK